MTTKNMCSDVRSADMILYNGNILTVDEPFSRVQALVIKDGRILSIGTTMDMKSLAGKNTRLIDLQGKTALPGFNDAHCHMWSFGIQLSQINCRSPPTKSINEIEEKFRNQATQTPPGQWIIGWGYDDTKLAEKRHPTKWDLDRSAPNHPAAIKRTCGHTMVVNTMALNLVGYGKATPQPEGGEIEKDPPTGEPTGILRETAMKPVNHIIRSFSVKEIEDAITLACHHAIKEGITSYQEAGLTTNAIRAYHNLHQRGKLPLRVNMMISADLLDSMIATGISTRFGDDQLRIGPIKIMMDGGIGGKTAALYNPYENTEDQVGIIYMTQEKLQKLVQKAHDADFQIAIHAIGDRAIDISLNALEQVTTTNPRENTRHRIEHCGLNTPAIIKRLQQLHILPVGQPPFLYNIGDSFRTNLGSKRTRWIYPFKTWLNKGLKPSGSSDRPVVLGAPLLGIWAAVNRKTEAGETLVPEERVTPKEAIQMYTIHSAYTSYEEHAKGSLEPGKHADIVILTDDPTTIPPDQIKNITVLATIIAGHIAYGTL